MADCTVRANGLSAVSAWRTLLLAGRFAGFCSWSGGRPLLLLASRTVLTLAEKIELVRK
ncbi:hypothetical protein D3C73_1523800 [compost metagenome]